MRRVFGVCVVLLLALGLFPGNVFGQSPSRDRGSQLRQNYPNPFNPDTKFSFDVFSHHKGVMKTPTWFDPAIKYPPFNGKLKLFKNILR